MVFTTHFYFFSWEGVLCGYVYMIYEPNTPKGIQSVIAYHNNSISKTLVDLYPAIGLDRSKFKTHKCMFALKTLLLSLIYISIWTDEWITVEKRRAFFETYAKDNRFNPLEPSNWYAQSTSKLLNTKVCLFCMCLSPLKYFYFRRVLNQLFFTTNAVLLRR